MTETTQELQSDCLVTAYRTLSNTKLAIEL